MAARLICAASFHQFKHLQQSCKILPYNISGRYLKVPAISLKYSPSIQRLQCLHEKVYDKEAGFDVQRNAMKIELIKDAETITENEIPEPKGRGRGRSMRTSHKATVKVENSEELRSIPEEIIVAEKPTKEEKINKESLSDPNIFGNADPREAADYAEDIEDEEVTQNFSRKWKKPKIREYAKLIKDNLNARNLKGALAVLEVKMLKEDRAKPDNYIYNLLISGCAKEGYTRKAFKLFSDMRKRGLKVKPSTYTSLFNACANAPSAQDSLGKATYLRELMAEKGYAPNVLNYNAMIKAFGRAGGWKTAYLLADEMIDRKLEPTLETFNFLLQACASDTQTGFRNCLLTWHKILQRGFTPDYYTFLTMLRCVRDCDFGDLESMQKVLQQIIQSDKNILYIANKSGTQAVLNRGESINSSTGAKEKRIDSSEEEEGTGSNTLNVTDKGLETRKVNPFATEKSIQVNTEASELELPNLLLPKPHLGSLVQLSEVRLPHERLLLLGGLNGFLAVMKDCKVTPDIETFTLMLDAIPPTYAAEKLVISWIRKIGLKADVDFFNILIKKRSMRFDYEGAKEVLSMIRTAGLYPDIVTYGVLSLGCQTVESARELLAEMDSKGFRMNIEILGAMLRQGCAQKNFSYIMEILQISLDERIKPNDIFLRHLHKFKIQCARAIDTRHPSTKSKTFKRGHKEFCDKLRIYYEELGIEGLKLEDAIKKIQGGPYDHYKEPDIDGVEPLKNEKKAKKAKLRKHIKKIKLAALRNDPEYVEKQAKDFKKIN